jgi:hypothetical protein
VDHAFRDSYLAAPPDQEIMNRHGYGFHAADAYSFIGVVQPFAYRTKDHHWHITVFGKGER